MVIYVSFILFLSKISQIIEPTKTLMAQVNLIQSSQKDRLLRKIERRFLSLILKAVFLEISSYY